MRPPLDAAIKKRTDRTATRQTVHAKVGRAGLGTLTLIKPVRFGTRPHHFFFGAPSITTVMGTVAWFGNGRVALPAPFGGGAVL